MVSTARGTSFAEPEIRREELLRSGRSDRIFNRDIYGYSFGGPILKNRTFFFTSYEGRQGHEVAYQDNGAQ